jgi:hypothetical protein
MLSADLKLFTRPYEFWITRQTSQLVTFLKRMRTTVKTSVAQAADMGTHVRTIDTYFPPQIPQALFDVILCTPYVPPAPAIPPKPD